MKKLIIIIFMLFTACISRPQPEEGAIQQAQKQSFELSANNLLNSVEHNYLARILNEPTIQLTFTIENGKFTEDSPTVKTSNLPEWGIVVINENGQIKTALYKIKWCAIKSYDDYQITITEMSKEECNIPN